MEKEVELFDKRFVHFMWDDELEGQKGFVANYINDLKLAVNQGYWTKYGPLHKGSAAYPFRTIEDERWCLCYCDPNYEIKKAFNEGKNVQILLAGGIDWRDVESGEEFERYVEEGRSFRIKPECPCEDCNIGFSNPVPANMPPEGYTLTMSGGYANSECPCEEGIDSKACAEDEKGKEKHLPTWTRSWNKCPGCRHEEKMSDEEPCSSCFLDNMKYEPAEKEAEASFRPFKDCDELVKFWSRRYQTGFRPRYTMPLVWVRPKEDRSKAFMVTGYSSVGGEPCVSLDGDSFGLSALFEDFEFLDGEPCGVEVKE